VVQWVDPPWVDQVDPLWVDNAHQYKTQIPFQEKGKSLTGRL